MHSWLMLARRLRWFITRHARKSHYAISLARVKYPTGFATFSGVSRQVDSESAAPVITLTTFSARFETVHWTIRSLLKQSESPHTVVLYLGSDLHEHSIPQNLQSINDKRFQIKQSEFDLGSHNKYWNALQDYPDKNVLVVDDDCIYDHNFVRSMINAHMQSPATPIVLYPWSMKWSSNGELLPRSLWKKEFKRPKLPSGNLFTMGRATLYPPGSLHSDVLDQELIKTFCGHSETGVLGADDSWLKIMATRAQQPILAARSYPRMLTLPETPTGQRESLTNTFVEKNYEGQIFSNLLGYFNLDRSNFELEEYLR